MGETELFETPNQLNQGCQTPFLEGRSPATLIKTHLIQLISPSGLFENYMFVCLKQSWNKTLQGWPLALNHCVAKWFTVSKRSNRIAYCKSFDSDRDFGAGSLIISRIEWFTIRALSPDLKSWFANHLLIQIGTSEQVCVSFFFIKQ